jgi:hypothetical protein
MAKAKKPKAAKAKKTAKRKPAAGKRPEATALTTKKDRSTIKLAEPKYVAGKNSFDARLTRFEKDAAGVSGDISALKAEAMKVHIHWPAFKDARDLGKMSDAKIGVYLAHFIHYVEVFGIPERARMSLGLFAENVLKDARKAVEEIDKLKARTTAAAKEEDAKAGAKTVAQQVADRAEESSRLARLGRGKQQPSGDAPAASHTNGGADGETSIDEIKRKIEAKEFVSPAERQKLADFDTSGATAQ